MDTVLVTSIGAALILYLFVAIEGYRTYGSEVRGDILLNYPQTGLVTMVHLLVHACALKIIIAGRTLLIVLLAITTLDTMIKTFNNPIS